MSLNNLDTVKRFYELVNSDPTQLPEVLDAEIQWEIVKGFPYGGTYNGLGSVFENFFGKVMQHFEFWNAEPHDYIDAGEEIVVLGTYHTKANVTGQDVDADFVHIWTVSNGKMLRLRQTADTVQLSRALNHDVPVS
ncbi:MAG: nuclear transport factor 2 family protein [Thermodesulfobacteriota bacterium]